MGNTKPMNKKIDTIVNNIPRACADETAAVLFLEAQRWGDMPICAHCESENVYQMKGRDGERNKRFLWRCKDCGKQYTVRVGTVFEDSRIPLRHWCYAFWAACASKKGVSALQIKRQTQVTYKSALFMMHRIRFAMADEPGAPRPLTGTVEVDETYVGGKPRHRGPQNPKKRGRGTDKPPVVAIVERNGDVRAAVVDKVNAKNLKRMIRENVDQSAKIMTDEASFYKGLGKEFEGGHHTVVHSRGEYSRGDVTTNAVEGFFSILKRGINGTFHSVSKKHLHRYVGEFAFRYNTRKITDGERVITVIKKAEGKRLMYKAPAE